MNLETLADDLIAELATLRETIDKLETTLKNVSRTSPKLNVLRVAVAVVEVDNRLACCNRAIIQDELDRRDGIL